MTEKITTRQVAVLMNSATTSIKDMRGAVQLALVALVEHASVHGDKRMLLNDAPEWIKSMSGVNMTAIVEWCVKFGGVAVGEGGFINVKGQNADFEGAKACEWWTLKPLSPFKGMDLVDDLGKLLKKVALCNKTADETGEHNKVYAPEGAVANIATIHANLVAIKDRADRAERLGKLQAEVDADNVEVGLDAAQDDSGDDSADLTADLPDLETEIA